jgi:hypothetical protein
MSHTGNKAQRYRRFPTNTKPTHLTVEDLVITKGGKLDSQVLEGEFQGNGVTVLTGLSTSQTFDVVDILNDDEKGVIIGYTTDSPYFQLFRNDGTGSKVVYIFPDMFKDEQYHSFSIGITDKLTVTLDGAETVFNTRIPSNTDTLYVINYSIY